MPRLPPSAYVTMAGLLPACAAALSLGEVVPRSALNQPFVAEIPITTASAEELSGLNISLASPETFERYGLPRPAFLGDMRFSVTPSSQGGVIRVSSAQPVVEPFVTLLLEVQWPQGRLLREYTVLLDPPAFAGAAGARAPQAPKAVAPAQQPTEQTAAAAETSSSGARVPDATAGRRSEEPSAGGTYGPVARNETLWGIANRYRSSSKMDTNQLMLAIFRANPEAFAGNINRLRAGAVLRLPGAEELRGLGRGEALAEVRRQNQQWRPSAATTAEPGRLQLVPPRESAKAPPPVQTATTATGGAAADANAKQLQSALDETRRQLALKDSELAALRTQLSEARQKENAGQGEAAVSPLPGEVRTAPAESVPSGSVNQPVPAPEAKASAATGALPPAVNPKASRQPAGSGSGSFLGGLIASPVLWITAALVLIGGWLLARRRTAGAAAGERWTPRVLTGGTGAVGGAARGGRPGDRDDEMIVVEERRATTTGAFDRSSPGMAPHHADAELPLERTISTDGPVNLDQADPIAESDFHMAYGLYDQAADILNAAAAREPGRKDLSLKLLEVYFVWENREGFLREAASFRNRIQSDTDPDWKRVVLMGKQLAPTDKLFAGAVAAATSEDLDFTLSGGGIGTVDMPLGDEAGSVDFDLSTGRTEGVEALDLDIGDSTQVAPSTPRPRRPIESPTLEAPTLIASDMDSSPTSETPTIEASYAGASTTETPTIEAPGGVHGEGTLETPTLETRSPTGTTARLRADARGDDSSEQTEEIDLDELGLDLTGLDEAARNMSTGLHEALPGSAPGSAELDLDLSTAATESTAEMRALGGEPEAPTLKQLTAAMEKKAAGRGSASGPPEDTVEQPQPGQSDRSQITRALDPTGQEPTLGIDLDLGAGGGQSEQDLTATGLRTLKGRIPEDATMTEVGTKLDLARAYIDMGDPDGARSILNEVLEEGDPIQRQEAQRLLNSMAG